MIFASSHVRMGDCEGWMAKPEPNLFDDVDVEAEARALAAADADIAAKRGHSHAAVKRWLERLAAGENVPFDPSED